MPLSSLSPATLFGDLPLLKVGVEVELPGPVAGDFYLGSAWRGLLGWEMRRLLCPFDGPKPCQNCRIRNHCPYFLLFEQQSALSGLRDAPKGYILYPPLTPPAPKQQQNQQHHQNQRQMLWITLFGNTTRFMPVIALALFNGQTKGLTKARHSYTITAWRVSGPGPAEQVLPLNPVAAESLPTPAPLSQWLAAEPRLTPETALHLRTPVRLRKKGNYLNQMDWPFLLASLTRRLEALHCLYHTGSPLGKTTWQALEASFEAAGSSSEQLEWQDWARYSSRQKKKVPLGGMTGTVTLNDAAVQLAEWWSVAALVHVGKGATLGLGNIELSSRGGRCHDA